MGATLGGAFAAALNSTGLIPPLSVPAFAMVGMGAMVGGGTGAVMTAVVMVFEMTLSYDIIMPILGIAGKADFTNYYVPLSSAVTATNLTDARKQGGVLAYGDFITVVINFLIVAIALFVAGLREHRQ